MYNKYFTMKRSELKEAIKAEIKSVLSEEITEAKFIKFKGDSDDNKMEVEAEREMNTPDGELKVYTVKTDDGVQSYTADQVELVEEDLNEGKMGQIVSLFQDMMDDEYDGQDYRKVLNMVLKAIDDDYKAAEREGEKFSRIREGTWSVGTKEQIGNFIKDVEKIKIHYNDIVGDDEVYNGLDSAVFRAEEMMGMVAENKSDLKEKEMTDAEKRKAAEKDAKKEKKFAGKQKEAEDLKTKIEDKKAEMVKKAKEYKAAEGEKKEKIKDQLKKMTAERDELNKQLEKLKKVEI